MTNLAEFGFEAPEDSGEWVTKILAVEVQMRKPRCYNR